MALLVPQPAAWLSTLAGFSAALGTQTAANDTNRVSQSLGATYLVYRCDMVNVSQRTCATLSESRSASCDTQRVSHRRTCRTASAAARALGETSSAVVADSHLVIVRL